MKNILLILVFIISSNLSWAQSKTKKDTLHYESKNDSLDLVNNFYDLLDSLTKKLYPADDYYNYWSTSEIEYKAGDSVNRTDSVMLVLINPLKSEKYVHPNSGNITSGFGYRRHRFHYGTDIDLNTGDPVYCAFDGMVRLTVYHGTLGKVVIVRHFNGLETIYAHLSSIQVDSNQQVKAGDLIGLGGSTGRSTGSHLHFEIRFLGAALNSETLIDYKTQSLIADTVWLTKKNFEYLHRIQSDKNASYHYVKAGETLSAIARRYGTSVNKLCYLNGIKETKILQIGEKLRVK
ncbi:MAG: peptidoglycan DD-metalloendopeptidase family protein [Bacteroidales bacterium]|nr:peptidoglycan DD-metalloendopeptidase family protein [Bacteroidales bacterium]